MKKTFTLKLALVALGAALVGATIHLTLAMAQTVAPTLARPPLSRPEGPCDIYGAANAPCVAAHSTARALYASYNGALYQVLRQSDGRKLDIPVMRASATDTGGYADAAVQDRFCANTACWISIIYDQSPKKNHLYQAPRGAFSGHATGGFNNVPLADAAPVMLMGHKVYGTFIAPGMGLRNNDVRGTAVDDQAQGQYWVINGQHFNNGCCFDYGNAETDSKDDGNGTMETTYYGNATAWFHGNMPGPWVMTDQENNLVGCTNPGSESKLCAGLPDINWRFVTAMAKGRPHNWASLGGDAQKGPLQVMYDGPRVDNTYDPMRKQGAILLGNGGDNSVGSQGTFYEGAMTAANTYPSHETDQLVQANIVAAHYDLPVLSVAANPALPAGLQSFTPGSTQDTTVTFTNSTGAPATGVRLSLVLPAGWKAEAAGPAAVGTVAPGASASVTFHVTSGPTAFNGDMVANAAWAKQGAPQSWRAVQKLRNGAPVRINEFRIGEAANVSNSFIELYNAGAGEADISGWSLSQHQINQAVASSIRVPANTRLAGHGFYLMALSTSGLAAAAKPGDSTIYVRSIDGLKVGETIRIEGESRRIAALGTAASPETTLWQPLPDGPIITIAKGATNVPVTSTAGFAVGEKIALGYGATYPAVSRGTERYEIATVTAVGKPGIEQFLAADAHPGETNISVTSVATITAGDKIRLDIDSVGHGIESVTVKSVGTPAIWLALTAEARAGATNLRLRPGTGVFNGQSANGGAGIAGLAVGHKLIVGMPGNLETVTIRAVNGASVDVQPALTRNHPNADLVVDPGTGLELTSPLKIMHAGNMPFSARGTGISFTPASSFPRSSNEPVQALGTGITLDRPLAQSHAIHAAVRSDSVTVAGYQGPTPRQWFGGPALSPSAGAMILRDAGGKVIDSLNYGLIVDPWAAEGYHGASGTGAAGCRVMAPGAGRGAGRGATIVTNSSAGRLPDGADSDSNCNDFGTQPATVLADGATAGSNNLKVAAVADFRAGQSVSIDSGAAMETATIAQVGTPGAAVTAAAIPAGETGIPLTGAAFGFTIGQAVTIDNGANRETASIAAIQGGRGGGRITTAAPLRFAHPNGTPVAGSGLTLSGGLTRAHAAGAQVMTDLPTPGAPNKFSARR